MIVASLGMGGLLVVRAQTRNIDSYARTAAAREYALSAIELGLQEIASNLYWRAIHKNDVGGIWYNDKTIGVGTYSLKVVNPSGPLDNSPFDPVVLTATGKVNNGIELQQVEVTLVPQTTPFTCLQTAETASLTLGLGTTTFQAFNQIIATNASMTTQGSGPKVWAHVQAVGTIPANTFYQEKTQLSPARTMPDPATVFDYYVSKGTAISYSSIPAGVMTSVLLSPMSNPYGATNPQGIYVIDCAGSNIFIQKCRIVGTLVLLNTPAAATSTLSTQNYLAPAVPNYPALMVKGGFNFQPASTSFTEPVNFNPPGTPYPYPSGVTNNTATDIYPNRIDGLIYVNGNLITQGVCTVGQVIVDGTISHQNGTVTLTTNPLYFNNPPPGFCSIKMVPSSGSWMQTTN